MSSVDINGISLLIVGAGGIGCELIKNIATLKIKKISIIDFDLVDVSNLNRQFLYKREHIGKPKCLVAYEVLKNYFKNSEESVEINCYEMDLRDLEPKKFSEHNVILSALDNIKARSLLSKLCFINKKPLIEAGSSGFNGQAYIIWSEAGTACYDCNNFEEPKSYSVCTIRSNPQKIEHCIGWGKQFFECLFGNDSSIDDFITNFDTTRDCKNINEQFNLIKHVFFSVFDDRIRQAINVFDQNSQDTSHIRLFDVKEIKNVIDSVENEIEKDLKFFEYTNNMNDEAAGEILDWKHSVLDFFNSFLNIMRKTINTEADAHRNKNCIIFDKDDDDIIQFICSASNLRAYCYSIHGISLWDCKTIVCNIIPSLVSINSIVAGLQIIFLTRIIKLINDKAPLNLENLEKYGLRFVWVRGMMNEGSILVSQKLEPRNISCLTCSSIKNRILVRNTSQTKFLNIFHDLKHFIKDVVMIQIDDDIIYDAEYDNEEKLFDDKTMFDLNLLPDKIINFTSSLGSLDFLICENKSLEQAHLIELNDHLDNILKLDKWKKKDNELLVDLDQIRSDESDSKLIIMSNPKRKKIKDSN